jgi:hypothetical protein
MKSLKLALVFLLASTLCFAQDEAPKKKKSTSVSLGTNGLQIKKDGEKTDDDDDDNNENNNRFHMNYCTIDLGINNIQDKTDYSSAAAQKFLNVDPGQKNTSLFDMNLGKSINVNIYPLMTKYRLTATPGFKMYLVSGLGLQFYNFRFNKNISYSNSPSPNIFMDTVSFSKNKLAFDYLNIPLGITCKSRLNDKKWLVYGVGITGGYRLASWTKQISGERGKTHNHSQFDFNDFNSCITAELGIDDVIRLYATYQLTSLQKDALDQHPFCIGIRFGGI